MQGSRFSNRRKFLQLAFAGGVGAAILTACGAPAASPAAPKSTSPSQPADSAKPTTAVAQPAAAAASPAAPKSTSPSQPTDSAKPTTAVAQPAAAGKQVTVRYATFWPQYRLDIMGGPLKAFTEKYPNIKVQMESAGTQYRDKLAIQMAGGTAADAGICDVWSQMRYTDQGMTQDLTDYLKKDNIDIQKESWLMGYEVLGGKTFAMPWVVSPHRWYYNKTMLKQAGAKDPWDDFKGEWTWADFKETLIKVSKLPPKDGKVKIYGAKLDMRTLEYQLGGFIYSNGAMNYSLEPYKYTLDDPKLIEAVEFVIEDLHLKEKVILPPDEATALTQGGVTDPFAAGIVGFQEDSTGRLTVTRDTVKDAFEWDVAPVPKPQSDSKTRATFAADANFVYSKSPNKDEAYQLLKFFSGYEMPDMQVELAKQKLLLPSNRKAAREFFATPPPAHVKTFVEGKFVGHFLHYKGNECNRRIEAELDKAILGQQPVKKSLLALNEELNKLVEVPKFKQMATSDYDFSA